MFCDRLIRIGRRKQACVRVCVRVRVRACRMFLYAFSRSAETSRVPHCVHDGSESLVGTGSATYTFHEEISPTNCPIALPLPWLQSGDSSRGKGFGQKGTGAKGTERGRDARVNRAARAHNQPQQPERIVGSSRAEQFPQIGGLLGPAQVPFIRLSLSLYVCSR